MIRVQAVVVTYNRKELLTECIDAILAQTVPVEKLILIDNNSTDGTEDYLRKKKYLDNSVIKYIRLPENIGGAGGFHEGMKVAREDEPDWVWIMDDDVLPTETCLEELLHAREVIDGKVSFLASAVRGSNDEAMNVPKINRKQFMSYTDWYRYLNEGIVQIVKATFVSLLINIEAIRQCGLPWSEFFIWGDDSEYTQRVIRDYGPAYMVGKSQAIHKRVGSDELSIVKEQNVKRIPMYFYYYRNNLIGFWEYEGALYRFLCMGKLGFDFLMVLIKGKYKFKKMGVILKAFFAFVFGTYDRKAFKNRAYL
ncbi:MAG: glycosyltransferase family 2 protein [Lachnospiraceae bacterium]|nr:glycosyltransferase family 2 protein [Lachnospiraceae bacterium]